MALPINSDIEFTKNFQKKKVNSKRGNKYVKEKVQFALDNEPSI